MFGYALIELNDG